MKNVQSLVESTLANLSPVTRQIMEWPKSKFMPAITYASRVSGVAAAHKGIELTKLVTVQICAGKDYSELAEVKDAIESGERGEVGELKGKTWECFPFTLTSDKTGERLVRLYPIKGKKAKTKFFLGKQEITREQVATYLQPAAARDLLEGKSKPVPCFDKRESELIGIGEIA